jgi:hypothetical protein
MNNINRQYIFNLKYSNIIPKLNSLILQKELNQQDLTIIDKPTSTQPKMVTTNDIIVGPTGPQGISGDRYSSKTLEKHIFDLKENSFIMLNIETGLAYISGNSIIVSEVPTKIGSGINSFEGIVKYYNSQSGQIIIENINNIKGTIEKIPNYYYLNLNAIPQPISYNIEQTSIPISLINNTVNIPVQDNNIQYYTLSLQNNDEVKYIHTSLKNNQQATILIKLDDNMLYLDDSILFKSSAIIYPILNINTSYNSHINLNNNSPYAILKINVIDNLVFGKCVSYCKNI